MSSKAIKQEDRDFRILRELESNPEITQREVASALNISVGAVNYWLNALIEKGWVKMQNFKNSKNKLGYVYVLTPQGVAERVGLTQRFLKRKLAEYESLKREIELLEREAGR